MYRFIFLMLKGFSLFLKFNSQITNLLIFLILISFKSLYVALVLSQIYSQIFYEFFCS